MMIQRDHQSLSLSRQCTLLGLSRSALYYTPLGESAATLTLLRRIDELYLQYPFYGSRQMARHLAREGVTVGRHRVRRLMRLLGLEAIYRKPRTSVADPEHRVYPYLLRGLTIDRPNQVWCADITYIPVQDGFLYLVAIMDWASRRVLAWRRLLKYEAVYLHELADGFVAQRVIDEWIEFYNEVRPHSALGGRTPAEAYRGVAAPGQQVA